MSQGYGPPDPNQPNQGQQPYGQQQYGQQPPGYPPPSYPPAPPPGYGQQAPQPSYRPAMDQPGTYMGRQLANWLQRVGAALIDWLIGAIPFFVFGLLAGAIGSGSDSGTASGGAGVLLGLGYLGGIAVYVYNRCILQGRTGQSWGKKALSLRLVRMADGQPLGGLLCFVRDVVHTLDGICLIGYLFPLWDARRQTFADKIMNTVVLSEAA